MQQSGHSAKAILRAVAACFLFTHTLARPAGFAIDFVGARSVGTATAGSAAAADASTIFFNPAGLAYLQRNEWMVGGNLFKLDEHFTDSGSTLLFGALPTPGNNGAEAIPSAFIPWIFGNYRYSPEVSVGIGIFSPFGLKTDYDRAFVGRYQNEATSLKVISVNPAVAYRPQEWIAVGAGINIEYARLRTTQAIDFGSACLAGAPPAACAAAGLVPGRSDGETQFKGHSVDVGFNLGVLLEFEDTRLSAAFRSKVNHNIDAKQSFTVPAQARALLTALGTPAALTGSNAQAGLPLPARLSVGVNQKIDQKLNLMADATLTMWDTFRTTVITPDSPATGFPVVIEQRYEDAWRFAVGAEYALGNQWTVRSGFAYDNTPVPQAFLQAALPDRDRRYFSFGASYGAPTSEWQFDVGYSYVQYVGRAPINRATANGDTLRGEFDTGGHVFAAQVRRRY